MPVVPALIAGAATVGGAVIASKGAKKAANTQAKAAADAQASNERMLARQIGLQEPFRQGGITAQSKIMELLGIGGDANSAEYGSAAKAFGNDQFQQDPGYAFRQSEGMKALERSAAARGGLMSGSALKGIQRFGQDLASQEYQNAFNRYQIERSARLNPLQSLMGSGQSATNVMTGNIGTSSQNEQNNITNAGAARASGYVGSANAMTGALNSLGNTAVQYPLYRAQANYFNNMGAGGGGYTGYGNGTFGSGPNPDGSISYASNYRNPTVA
jgi:hypothetical protein